MHKASMDCYFSGTSHGCSHSLDLGNFKASRLFKLFVTFLVPLLSRYCGVAAHQLTLSCCGNHCGWGCAFGLQCLDEWFVSSGVHMNVGLGDVAKKYKLKIQFDFFSL